MKKASITLLVFFSCFMLSNAQVTESYIQFANHTDLHFTAELRVDGSTGMVEAGQTLITPWQNPNHHKIGDYVTVVILDLVFDIYINHQRDRYLAICDRFSISGDKDYSLEIDISHDGELLFTILYELNDLPFNIFNPVKYNVRYPDDQLDVDPWYSSSVELGNNPHDASREIMIDGLFHKLIYGTFYEDLDPTKDVMFSLSETDPVSFHMEPDSADLDDPTVLNILTYNTGILMPLGASDKEEEERAAVMYKGLPRNMDIIIFNEFFDPVQSRRILNSLLPFYPYQTDVLNSIEFVPGLQTGGGVVIVSKFPILEEGDYSYRFDGDADIDGLDLLANKGVKYAKIDKHGQIIHVFGTHMHYQPTDPPNMSQFIYETVTPNREEIVIMGGDMNANVYSPKYGPMMDTFNAVEPTYLTFTHQESQRGTSWNENHYHPSDGDRPNNIDYVFASADFKIPVVSYNDVQAYRLNITDRAFWGIFDLGDHQPVYGRFEFPSIMSVDADTLVCEGDNLLLEVTTTLAEFSVEWYKDDILLPGEDQLIFSKPDINPSDWGNYRCELMYSFSPDEDINGSNPNYGPYIYPGAYEGSLEKEFHVGPDPDICGIATGVFYNTEEGVLVYPNPTGDWLNVNAPGLAKFQLRVFNTLGEMVHHSYHSDLAKINTMNWTPGIYYLELMVEGQLVFGKSISRK